MQKTRCNAWHRCLPLLQNRCRVHPTKTPGRPQLYRAPPLRSPHCPEPSNQRIQAPRACSVSPIQPASPASHSSVWCGRRLSPPFLLRSAPSACSVHVLIVQWFLDRDRARAMTKRTAFAADDAIIAAAAAAVTSQPGRRFTSYPPPRARGGCRLAPAAAARQATDDPGAAVSWPELVVPRHADFDDWMVRKYVPGRRRSRAIRPYTPRLLCLRCVCVVPMLVNRRRR